METKAPLEFLFALCSMALFEKLLKISPLD